MTPTPSTPAVLLLHTSSSTLFTYYTILILRKNRHFIKTKKALTVSEGCVVIEQVLDAVAEHGGGEGVVAAQPQRLVVVLDRRHVAPAQHVDVAHGRVGAGVVRAEGERLTVIVQRRLVLPVK